MRLSSERIIVAIFAIPIRLLDKRSTISKPNFSSHRLREKPLSRSPSSLRPPGR